MSSSNSMQTPQVVQMVAMPPAPPAPQPQTALQPQPTFQSQEPFVPQAAVMHSPGSVPPPKRQEKRSKCGKCVLGAVVLGVVAVAGIVAWLALRDNDQDEEDGKKEQLCTADGARCFDVVPGGKYDHFALAEPQFVLAALAAPAWVGKLAEQDGELFRGLVQATQAEGETFFACVLPTVDAKSESGYNRQCEAPIRAAAARSGAPEAPKAPKAPKAEAEEAEGEDAERRRLENGADVATPDPADVWFLPLIESDAASVQQLVAEWGTLLAKLQKLRGLPDVRKILALDEDLWALDFSDGANNKLVAALQPDVEACVQALVALEDGDEKNEKATSCWLSGANRDAVGVFGRSFASAELRAPFQSLLAGTAHVNAFMEAWTPARAGMLTAARRLLRDESVAVDVDGALATPNLFANMDAMMKNKGLALHACPDADDACLDAELAKLTLAEVEGLMAALSEGAMMASNFAAAVNGGLLGPLKVLRQTNGFSPNWEDLLPTLVTVLETVKSGDDSEVKAYMFPASVKKFVQDTGNAVVAVAINFLGKEPLALLQSWYDELLDGTVDTATFAAKVAGKVGEYSTEVATAPEVEEWVKAEMRRFQAGLDAKTEQQDRDFQNFCTGKADWTLEEPRLLREAWGLDLVSNHAKRFLANHQAAQVTEDAEAKAEFGLEADAYAAAFPGLLTAVGVVDVAALLAQWDKEGLSAEELALIQETFGKFLPSVPVPAQ